MVLGGFRSFLVLVLTIKTIDTKGAGFVLYLTVNFSRKINYCEFKLIDHALLKAWQISSHAIKSANPPK